MGERSDRTKKKPEMPTRVVPIAFAAKDDDFAAQMKVLEGLFGEQVAFLPEIAIGAPIPAEADAVVFPQLLGEAYARLDEFRAIDRPILIITSEFGTLSMWDWEIIEFLRSAGVRTLAPYNADQARTMFRAAAVRSKLRSGTFLMYQDNPGDGQQASIFKRFWWWEKACRTEMAERLGVRVVYKSYKDLGERMKEIDDAAALAEWKKRDIPSERLADRAKASAMKLLMTVDADIAEHGSVLGVGINCLNESHFSDTTPCLAWSLLYDEKDIMWACEADIVSLATKYIMHRSLEAPTVMTNIYPFLMGMAALKHEKIPNFPEILENPDDHILVAHCGYFALAPRSFCSSWCLKPSALGIVNENSNMMDARFPVGPVTFTKLDPHFRKLFVMQGKLKGYAQYPGSDCLNGGIIEVSDGHKMMRSVYSHHQCLMTGHQSVDARIVADVFGLEIDEV